ncbi:MAG: sugar ABC transporter permease [Spirochaetales bacterium]|nr:sugar ABC transporter permease [Spirochaetales bacterium]
MRKRISAWLDHETHLAYTILIPVLLLLIVFAYLPAAQSFRFSMLRYNLKMPNKINFNGLDNYIYILKDPVFRASVIKVIYFMIVATITVLLLSLGFALVLNQKFKGKGFLRAIVIIPWAIPPVVNGHLWKWIFNGDYGALNGLLYQLGIIEDYHYWLNNPFVALNMAIFLFVWRYTPFITILFLGVLQSIPGQLYEAAEVDGAGPFRRLYYVTIPYLSKIGGIAVILTVIASFNVFDGIFALMDFAEPTKTPMIYNYQITFEMGRFGRGSAMAYLVGFFLFILTMIYMRMSLKKDTL